MDILIEKVSDKSFFILNILKIFNKNIYYLKIESKDNNKLYHKLKSLNINPLPIEDLKKIPYSSYSDMDFDPHNLILKKINLLYSRKISEIFLKKISNNSHKVVKLLLKDVVTNQFSTLNAYIDVWLKNNKKLLFITTNFLDIFLVNKKKNLILIYLPYGLFNYFIKFFINIYSKLKSIILNLFQKFKQPQKNINKKNEYNPKVAYVLHGDTFYGGTNNKNSLYNKNLYYSKKQKDFKKENIIHFGYNLRKLSDLSLKYQYLSDKKLILKDFKSIFIFVLKSIFSIRKFSDILLIGIFAINLKYFLNCRNIFKKYPKLKLAIIDYDFLCPKIITLALMSLKIRTVCTQERFISSFYNTQNILIDDYFTPSKKINLILKKNKSVYAKKLIPVGLYRADKLSVKKDRRKKIIVALGFHTENKIYESQSEILLNWKASRLFLEEIYKLSKELDDYKIIIRFKNYKGYQNSYFKKILKKIKKQKNLKIDNAKKSEHSYKICSMADLIIAKHTSLADECISRGIPVIIHDYTHNLSGIIRGAFKFDESLMICKNYEDMLNKTKKFLNYKKNNTNKKFLNFKNKYYFYNENTTVKKEILNYINRYLQT